MGHKLYLAEWRTYLGKTQDAMADAAGYSHRANFGRVERGLKKISMDKLLMLGSSLAINPGHLFFPPPSDSRSQLVKNISELNDEDIEVVASLVRSLLDKSSRAKLRA